MRVAAGFRQHRNERSAVAVMFVVFLVGMLGAAAYAIDLGNSWQTRRKLVLSTDAAALAGAQQYVEGNQSENNACYGSGGASEYLQDNFDGATMTVCDVVGNYILVEAEFNVEYIFGPAVGVDEELVTSRTAVAWSQPNTISGGLRPFGLCVDRLEEVVDPLSLEQIVGNGVTYRIFYGKDDQPDACGGDAPGNWGVIDFDGGGNSNNDTKDWTMNGYPGDITVPAWYPGDPGAFSNSLNSELQFLVNNVDCFTLPIFDDVNPAGGNNASFHIVEFATVRLNGYKANGNQDNRYLDIEFVPCVVQGTGDVNNDDLGPKIIGICAVDGTDLTDC